MVRKKRKRIVLGRMEEAVVSSYDAGISPLQETKDAEYELWRSLTACLREAELALDRMKAEDERQANI